jgi:hypothetical protein
MKPRWTKWLKIALPGCVLLQLTGCFGADPQFYFASSIANAVVFNIVSTLVNLVFSGLSSTTAMLLG